jgi:hypothetical protein
MYLSCTTWYSEITYILWNGWIKWTCVSSHTCFQWWNHLKPSNLQKYNILLLIVVIILCSRSLELFLILDFLFSSCFVLMSKLRSLVKRGRTLCTFRNQAEYSVHVQNIPDNSLSSCLFILLWTRFPSGFIIPVFLTKFSQAYLQL